MAQSLSEIDGKSLELHAIDDSANPGFLPGDYSLFKHGSARIAQRFGEELGQKIAAYLVKCNLDQRPVLIFPSPYQFIPTCTLPMMEAVLRVVNRQLFQAEMPPALGSRIYRETTYSVDYGALDAQERLCLIGNDVFHVDKEFLEGKLCVFLDDIRVTGGHEVVMRRMLQRQGISCDALFAYFATVTNPEIPASFENVLNHAAVCGLPGVEGLVRVNDFTFNTRVVKMILGSPLPAAIAFLEGRDNLFLRELTDLAIGNRYFEDPNFKVVFEHLLARTSG